LLSTAGCQSSRAGDPPGRADTPSLTRPVLEAEGKTQAAPGHSASIAPVVLHPVVQVLVKAGDRVKKDQALVKLDDDEPQADLRARKAALAELQSSLARLKAQPREAEREEARASAESARLSADTARLLTERLDPLWHQGSVSDLRHKEAQLTLRRAIADHRSATARLDRLLKLPIDLEVAEAEARVASAKAGVESSQAELEHYTVSAGIDGVISWLEVSPGTVSRPGTSVWGEILDLTVLDVRCDLTPAQADRLTLDEPAQVFLDENPSATRAGRVVYIGIAADPHTGRVPVLVRLNNTENPLRCRVPVRVRIGK
jgi:membrane fusion protein (multidrug efflux system)